MPSASRVKGLLHGPVYSPSTRYPRRYRFGGYPCGFRPVIQDHRDSINGKPDIGMSVPRLLFSGGPAAVPRFVVPIIVRVAVDGVVGRRLTPHVRQEVLEGVNPSFAHGDAASTVDPVSVVVGVLAAVEHQSPRGEFSALLSALGVPMGSVRFALSLTPVASTGKDLSSLQPILHHVERHATLTATGAKRSLPSLGSPHERFSDYSEPSELRSGVNGCTIWSGHLISFADRVSGRLGVKRTGPLPRYYTTNITPITKVLHHYASNWASKEWDKA